MSDEDWSNFESRCFGLRLAGNAIEELDDRGNRIIDDSLLILINAHHEAIPFTLPAHRRKVRWQVIFDTYEPNLDPKKPRFMRGGENYDLKDRSLAVLRLPHAGDEENGADAMPALRRSRRDHAARASL